MAINNHYEESEIKPLAKLVHILRSPNKAETQAELSSIMDMEAWGKFSAYESLANIFTTFDRTHKLAYLL